MTNTHDFRTNLHRPLPPLSAQYRAYCAEDLGLLRAILCHPSIGRRRSPGALDHSFTLPDGHGVTVRASRIRVPRALINQLADDYVEYFILKDKPIYMYSVSIKVDSTSEVVVRGVGGTNHTRAQNRRRTRAAAEALHRPQDAHNIYENGTDLALPGRRFSWLGTQNIKPLPCPAELFSPRTSAA